MVAQRRYSVTGQTPPDDIEAMKARSPKLQALDTSAQTAGCALCEVASSDSSRLPPATDYSSPDQPRGRTMAHAGTVIRTSSKRSATQLPSPTSPSHELPPKVARYCLLDPGHLDTDTDTESDSDTTDIFCEHDEKLPPFESHTTSLPSSPELSQPPSVFSLPDAASLEQLQLHSGEVEDDGCIDAEQYALSSPRSRNYSLDCRHFEEQARLQQEWTMFKQAFQEETPPPFQDTSSKALPNSLMSATFLTLPPEIRHQIYLKCEKLVFETPLVYCISTFDNDMQHPLAAVCHLVRSEVLAIFYSYNIWAIKVEFKMMYEAFQDWIIRLGDGAGFLRLVNLSVRGSLFKPTKKPPQSYMLHGQLIQFPPGGAAIGSQVALYCPPDGDACFKIDLSEKFVGGRVQTMRNDGSKEAGERARLHLTALVSELWERRKAGSLNGQDWITLVDRFIAFCGGMD